MSSQKDTVHLLRAIMKILVSMGILDSIIDLDKYYKYGFKREARRWESVIDIHTDELVKTLVGEDSKTVNEIYQIIESSLDKVQMSTPEQTSLLCYYVMLKSATNDIANMENRNMVYAGVIDVVTKKVLNQIGKQYSFILDIKDIEGNDITYLVEFLDKLGENVLVISGKNENNEDNKEGVVQAKREDRV